MVDAKQPGGQGHRTSGFAPVFSEANISSGTYSETPQARIDKLIRVIEAIPGALIIADAKSNIEYVNPRFTQITGYDYLEVIGKPVGMLDSHGAHVDEHRRGRDIAAADGSWHGEFCGRGKRGATYWSQRSICPLRDADGLITNYVIYDEDIAPLRSLEARLRRSQ